MRRTSPTIATLSAPAGLLAVFAFERDGMKRNEAMPAIAIEVEGPPGTLGKGSGDTVRQVRAVAITGEVAAADLMSALEFADGRVADYVGELYANRDAWLAALARHLKLRLPRRKNGVEQPPALHVVSKHA